LLLHLPIEKKFRNREAAELAAGRLSFFRPTPAKLPSESQQKINYHVWVEIFPANADAEASWWSHF
jgi:hypothetical protein